MQEKLEEVVEETTQETSQQDSGDENVVKVDESKFESAGDDDVIKVDLSKPPTKEDKVETEVVAEDKPENEVVTEVTDETEAPPEVETQETPVLEEITEDKVEEIATEVEEAITESMNTGKELPENIQKLVDFMEETGGDLSDYVKLNQDYSTLNDEALLKEYYTQTKPHLNTEEINFLMEDQFSYEEDVDDDRDIRKKKIALKEQVANAKSHLDGQKSKYYEEIKAGSKLTTEQQKAVNFFDRYNKESEVKQKTVKTNTDIFTQKTNNVFNDKFKGFEYDVGDKKYRFNVNNAEEVKTTQSDLSNFTKKFLDKNSALTDAKGYHKSLYTAMNADAVAKHFYDQGKADAMKNSITKAKNVDMNPRQAHGKIEASGMKFKVLGDNSSDFKFKIKNKNK
jgi:hypothetical protein